MSLFARKHTTTALEDLGIHNFRQAYWNETPEALIESTICRQQGVLADNGALVIRTGKFTGRSPEDRYIVKDEVTTETVDWNNINRRVSPAAFQRLYQKITHYFCGGDVFVRDAYACSDPDYRLNVRVITEYPWSNLFAYNMFLRPTEEELTDFSPDWTVICAPGFLADPVMDEVKHSNFAILNFSRRCILIGGTAYTGEIKKGIFSALNFLLPHEHDVLSMHCSANMGEQGDVAVFFGLSGTGKTTLSADPDRALIGDDEHGWSERGIFNFEGGCYAKTIDLTEEKEPDIFRAIRHGALLENVELLPGTRTVDYSNDAITENTRVSYPLHHIDNVVSAPRGDGSGAAGHPNHIFFLTCDAFGVLPPIARLTPEQAMYYFISGYTAKVAGTEEGIDEPQPSFSACFGAPFLPLHPARYAEMLGEQMKKHQVDVWLVNTGWTGGPHGTGSRIKLPYTRAMISAALRGELAAVDYREDEIFGFAVPTYCPGVPTELLHPRSTWADTEAYDRKAELLAQAFQRNFAKYADETSEAVAAAGPSMVAEMV